MRIYHFVTSIADNSAKQLWYAPRTSQNAFYRTLTLEAGQQLAKDIPSSDAGLHQCILPSQRTQQVCTLSQC